MHMPAGNASARGRCGKGLDEVAREPVFTLYWTETVWTQKVLLACSEVDSHFGYCYSKISD